MRTIGADLLVFFIQLCIIIAKDALVKRKSGIGGDASPAAPAPDPASESRPEASEAQALAPELEHDLEAGADGNDSEWDSRAILDVAMAPELRRLWTAAANTPGNV